MTNDILKFVCHVRVTSPKLNLYGFYCSRINCKPCGINEEVTVGSELNPKRNSVDEATHLQLDLRAACYRSQARRQLQMLNENKE